jgi:hypothetical protein
MYERQSDAAMRIRHAAVWSVVACGWKGDVRNGNAKMEMQGFMFVESHCMKRKNDARLA